MTTLTVTIAGTNLGSSSPQAYVGPDRLWGPCDLAVSGGCLIGVVGASDVSAALVIEEAGLAHGLDVVIEVGWGTDKYDLKEITVTYQYPGVSAKILDKFQIYYSAYRAIDHYESAMVNNLWNTGSWSINQYFYRACQESLALAENLSGLSGSPLDALKSTINVLENFQTLGSILEAAFDYTLFWINYNGPSKGLVQTRLDAASSTMKQLAQSWLNLTFDGEVSSSDATALNNLIADARDDLTSLRGTLRDVALESWWVWRSNGSGEVTAEIMLNSLTPLLNITYSDGSLNNEPAYLTSLIDALVAIPCGGPAQASSPFPTNGASNVSMDADLNWANASEADSYHVYFGTDSTPDGSEYHGNTESSSWPLGTLTEDTTYYWRIDTSNGCGTTTGQVWSFTTVCPPPNPASSPYPLDGAGDMSTDADLNWAGASGADIYDVYFGTDSTPDNGEYQVSTRASNWSLPTLDEDTTYYWRIDASSACGTKQGDVWSFTTVCPPASQVCCPNPPDAAENVLFNRFTELTWRTGAGADSFDVYFGTDPTPDGGEYLGTTSEGWLALEHPIDEYTTYYWRVDASNSCGVMPGPVWSFGTGMQYLRITYPNGGETWQAGSTETITWESVDSEEMITISLSFGTHGVGIGQVRACDGEFDWKIPRFVDESLQYRIEVSSRLSEGRDSSDGAFSIIGALTPPSITVRRPSTGDVWEAGTTQTIEWDFTDPIGYASIRVHAGEDYRGYVGEVPLVDGKASWSIPYYMGDATDYVVRVQWSGGRDSFVEYGAQSEPFEVTGSLSLPTIVVTAPNGGETWTAGSTAHIQWECDAILGSVSVYLMQDGACLSWLGSHDVVSGGFHWTIPLFVGDADDYGIQVFWYQSDAWVRDLLCYDDAIGDVNDSNFAIVGSEPVPTVTVTSPVAGDTLAAGSQHLITWTVTGAQDGVVFLDWSHNGIGGPLGEAPLEDGAFLWELSPYTEDGKYRIYLHARGDGWSSSSSSEDFSIAGSLGLPVLTVTRPNGGEVVQTGTSHTITWDVANPAEDVEVILAKGVDSWGPVDLCTLGTAPMADGVFEWQLSPLFPGGTNFSIKLRWSDVTAWAWDESDCGFRIEGQPRVAEFVACLTGPGSFSLDSECELFDSDVDSDVDMNDFARLSRVPCG